LALFAGFVGQTDGLDDRPEIQNAHAHAIFVIQNVAGDGIAGFVGFGFEFAEGIFLNRDPHHGGFLLIDVGLGDRDSGIVGILGITAAENRRQNAESDPK
jgi:hypothetical protein